MAKEKGVWKTPKSQPTDELEKNAAEMLDSYESEGDSEESKQIPDDLKDKLKKGKKLEAYLAKKKQSFKETKYRKKYDAILDYMDKNLVSTETYQAALKSNSTQVAYSYVYENGSYTQIPMISKSDDTGVGRIPYSKEPIAFSKIMTAVSVLGGKAPDATFLASDKVYARTQYDLWKRTWTNPKSNGLPTLQNFYQNVLGSGFGAYRVYPRTIQHMSQGVPRIIFDDIYRQAINPRRIWIGSSVNIYDRWSRGECVYEVDQDAKTFKEKYEDSKYFQLESAVTVEETGIDDTQKQDFVTIRYYENPITNKYCVACGNYPIYEGEMPNDDGFGHVVWANCFINNPSDPYGVGLVEIMRGNTEMYDYIERLSAEQVEAEISPLLFGTNTGVGEMTYRRGPNVINPKGQGTSIDIVKTSGNVQQSLIFADSQKQKIAENTGINDILAGNAGEGTLGATVIMKEAALNRLIIPRNSVVACIEDDAYITVSWIKQTYTVDKIIEFNSDSEVETFIKLNPEYFVYRIDEGTKSEPESFAIDTTEYEEETKKEGGKYGYSKKVPLSFDIKMKEGESEEEDSVEEITSEYSIPSSELFNILKDRGHISDRIQIIVDPTSTLLPSEEINKQRITQVYQMVTPATVQIMQFETQMPELARTMMMQLDHILEVNKESVYDWVPKDVYDRIMTVKPPAPTPQTMVGGPEGASAPQPMQNTPSPMGPMTQEFSSDMKMGGPSDSMGDAMQASIGRAAKGNI